MQGPAVRPRRARLQGALPAREAQQHAQPRGDGARGAVRHRPLAAARRLPRGHQRGGAAGRRVCGRAHCARHALHGLRARPVVRHRAARPSHAWKLRSGAGSQRGLFIDVCGPGADPGGLRGPSQIERAGTQVYAVRVDGPGVSCAGRHRGRLAHGPAGHRGPPQERRHVAQGLRGGGLAAAAYSPPALRWRAALRCRGRHRRGARHPGSCAAAAAPGQLGGQRCLGGARHAWGRSAWHRRRRGARCEALVGQLSEGGAVVWRHSRAASPAAACERSGSSCRQRELACRVGQRQVRDERAPQARQRRPAALRWVNAHVVVGLADLPCNSFM